MSGDEIGKRTEQRREKTGDDAATLDELWDAWVPEGDPPVRARVQSGLGGTCRVEMIVTAAVDPPA